MDPSRAKAQKPNGRNRSLPCDPSLEQKMAEAKYFVIERGMSIEQAAAIVCCEPSDVQLVGGRPVDWIPTPAEIRLRCASVQRGWTADERRLRLASPRAGAAAVP